MNNRSKIVPNLKKLLALVNEFRKNNKKIGFTNGTFDILHAGHVRYLKKARSLTDVLIVAVNSDSSVRSYKGDSRPINSQADRVEVLSGLESIDYLIVFKQSTPLHIIKAIKPDVLIKGADWKSSEVVGGKEVKSWGGKVVRVRVLKGRSTSAIIKKILKTRDIIKGS